MTDRSWPIGATFPQPGDEPEPPPATTVDEIDPDDSAYPDFVWGLDLAARAGFNPNDPEIRARAAASARKRST